MPFSQRLTSAASNYPTQDGFLYPGTVLQSSEAEVKVAPADGDDITMVPVSSVYARLEGPDLPPLHRGTQWESGRLDRRLSVERGKCARLTAHKPPIFCAGQAIMC